MCSRESITNGTLRGDSLIIKDKNVKKTIERGIQTKRSPRLQKAGRNGSSVARRAPSASESSKLLMTEITQASQQKH